MKSILILLISVTLGSSAFAQEKLFKQVLSTSVNVYDIKHASPQSISAILTRVFPKGTVKVATDSRTNMLVVSAPRPYFSQIDALIKKLDSPESALPREESVVLQPRHRRVDRLKKLIEMHVSQSGRFAIDSSRNAIVVRDNAEAVARLREAMAKVDVEAQTVTLEFLVLEPGGKELGEEFKDLSGELRTLGLGNYGVHSRAAIKVLEGNVFDIQEKEGKHALSLRGTVQLRHQSGSAEVNLSVSVSSKTGRVKFDTTLAAPVGDLIVVGLSPSPNPDGEHLALALRVTSRG